MSKTKPRRQSETTRNEKAKSLPERKLPKMAVNAIQPKLVGTPRVTPGLVAPSVSSGEPKKNTSGNNISKAHSS
jgi:hypothetical protein